MQRQTIVGAVATAARPRHPLFADPASTVVESAPVFVAAALPGYRDDGVACVLDGWLFEPELLAARLGRSELASDAELLARAYLAWGDAMLDEIEGELAFVVWRPDRRQGLVARDRSGTRPMFYAAQGGRLHIASEVGELITMLPRRPAPDDVAVSWALSRWSVHDDRTLFADVMRLPAGSALRIHADGFSRFEFWRPQPSAPPPVSRAEAGAHIRELIERAVGRRVRADDVPAVQLSGGLDSSTIAAVSASGLAARGKALRGYSAGFPGNREADESAQLDILASALGIEQVRMEVAGGSPLRAGLSFLDRWSVPLGPPNYFVWEPLLRRAAEDGMTVIFDGNGGDELFAAAPYLLADRIRRGRFADAARLARRIPGQVGGRRDLARTLFDWGVDGLLPQWLAGRSPGPPPPLLGPQGLAWFRSGAERTTWRRRRGPRWWASQTHLLTRAGEALGVNDYARRAAESAGLVSRHPLLDPDLVDFVLSLPPEWSFDPVFTRPLLREAGSGLLPDEIRMRRQKADFGRVFADPLFENDLPMVRDLIRGPASEVLRYLDPVTVERELLAGPAANPRGRVSWALETWRVANIELWLRLQSNSASALGFIERAMAGDKVTRTFFILDGTHPSARLRSR